MKLNITSTVRNSLGKILAVVGIALELASFLLVALSYKVASDEVKEEIADAFSPAEPGNELGNYYERSRS